MWEHCIKKPSLKILGNAVIFERLIDYKFLEKNKKGLCIFNCLIYDNTL